MPTSVRPGRVSLRSSSRFAASSGLKNVNPVTFPPGRARLDTPQSIADHRHDDGDRGGGLLGGQDPGRPMGDNHINLETN